MLNGYGNIILLRYCYSIQLFVYCSGAASSCYIAIVDVFSSSLRCVVFKAPGNFSKTIFDFLSCLTFLVLIQIRLQKLHSILENLHPDLVQTRLKEEVDFMNNSKTLINVAARSFHHFLVIQEAIKTEVSAKPFI